MSNIIIGNQMFKDPACDNDDTLKQGNLLQKVIVETVGGVEEVSRRPICQGKTGLKFEKTNLINAELPLDSVISADCNNSLIDYCANIPENSWMNLPVCPPECRHFLYVAEIEIEFTGETKLVNVYENKVL